MKVKDILTLKELKTKRKFSIINADISQLTKHDYWDLSWILIKSNVWQEVNTISKAKEIINDRMKQSKFKLWLIKQRNNLYLKLTNVSKKGYGVKSF